MRYLYKVYHSKNLSEFEQLYANRLSFDTACKLNIRIKPMNQPNSYPLFYIPTNQMLIQMSEVNKISKTLEDIFKELPEVAKDQFILECLVEELFNTNELEGVRSSREEIARSAKDIQLNKKNETRFNSMIQSYLKLKSGEFDLPKNSIDIRRIYDEITQDEIAEDDLPDGQIFRSEPTFVLKKSGTGKVIHQGVIPEEQIIEDINQLLSLLNEHEGIPDLIKVAIGHYYFGYIHPFYDGNGRTSRFISSMYLSRYLGMVSAFALSRGSNKFRNDYLRSFEETNSLKNRGELNYFIETFLTILMRTLAEMTAELKEKVELLNLAIYKIQHEPLLFDLSDEHKNMLLVIAQNHFFDHSKGLTIKDFANIFSCSESTVRKRARALIEISLVEQVGKSPAYYIIKDGYFES